MDTTPVKQEPPVVINFCYIKMAKVEKSEKGKGVKDDRDCLAAKEHSSSLMVVRTKKFIETVSKRWNCFSKFY